MYNNSLVAFKYVLLPTNNIGATYDDAHSILTLILSFAVHFNWGTLTKLIAPVW